MKFIFVSDLHSNILLYNDLENLISSEKPDFLIIGGDIFAYSPHVEPQVKFAEEYLCQYIKRVSIPIYYIPGNCDKPLSVSFLNKIHDDGLLNLLTLTGTKISGIEFIGYSFTPPNPFKIKDWERRDLKEDDIVFENACLLSDNNDKLNLVANDFLNDLPSIEDDLNILYNKNSIWVMHSPPYGGVLDKNYTTMCCGSKAIRKSIEHVQPILTLHGHIHEAPCISHKWSEQIGNTISINPGSGELLQAVVVEINKNRYIASLKHTIYGEL